MTLSVIKAWYKNLAVTDQKLFWINLENCRSSLCFYYNLKIFLISTWRLINQYDITCVPNIPPWKSQVKGQGCVVKCLAWYIKILEASHGLGYVVVTCLMRVKINKNPVLWNLFGGATQCVKGKRIYDVGF